MKKTKSSPKRKRRIGTPRRIALRRHPPRKIELQINRQVFRLRISQLRWLVREGFLMATGSPRLH